jgi:hypothetical protein
MAVGSAVEQAQARSRLKMTPGSDWVRYCFLAAGSCKESARARKEAAGSPLVPEDKDRIQIFPLSLRPVPEYGKKFGVYW